MWSFEVFVRGQLFRFALLVFVLFGFFVGFAVWVFVADDVWFAFFILRVVGFSK